MMSQSMALLAESRDRANHVVVEDLIRRTLPYLLIHAERYSCASGPAETGRVSEHRLPANTDYEQCKLIRTLHLHSQFNPRLQSRSDGPYTALEWAPFQALRTCCQRDSWIFSRPPSGLQWLPWPAPEPLDSGDQTRALS